MELKHTRGPWQVLPEECDKPYIRIRGTQLGGRYKIANVLTPTYEGVHEREARETRANAELIAAAPELLDLLIAARQQLPLAAASWNEDDNEQVADFHRKRTMDLISQIDSTIAKAAGSQA